VDGNNPHSIHCYVEGGLEEDIHKSIRETRAGGIWCMGTQVQEVNYRGTIVRSAFSRFLYNKVTYTVEIQINPALWRAEYVEQIKLDVQQAVNNRSLIEREFTFATLLSATFRNRNEAIYDIELFEWTFDGVLKGFGDTVIVDTGRLPRIELEDIIVTTRQAGEII
jgi:hypothetical protein